MFREQCCCDVVVVPVVAVQVAVVDLRGSQLCEHHTGDTERWTIALAVMHCMLLVVQCLVSTMLDDTGLRAIPGAAVMHSGS